MYFLLGVIVILPILLILFFVFGKFINPSTWKLSLAQGRNQVKLEGGRLIAVKKLSVTKSQLGESEFLSEVRMITSIQHKNLVRLLECCLDGDQWLLVYEYMKNRSLDLIIYGKTDLFLSWSTLFQIILGIAQGLQYLHEDSHVRIIHWDIKASNILLDNKFQPRIGDFGLARFFPEDQAYLSTNFAGTL
ncbi:probable LRR receptor-like serine threonine-kinase At1g56140 isoform X2 [Olea europaea subsp. europaea]|uniref:non-specific serine/threonine protein kinase n=1 Tax=Olea europaea subsp. europaea TaxID=158383 RepID=A0A8S0RVC9_OLEEU|nr:probable LRR receptor-like serine threonine-kinase At1g56140 isoform X2 [Olea europaea subsp. europaea]